MSGSFKPCSIAGFLYQVSAVQFLIKNIDFLIVIDYLMIFTTFNCRFSYFVDPFEEKSLTSYSETKIFVPWAMIRKYQTDLPDYVNFAKVGFDLARQMARHFDPTGIKVDLTLTPEMETGYKKYVKLMSVVNSAAKSYGGNQNISYTVNGSLSVEERIVDNIALRLVLDTLLKDPENLQMPFISPTFSKEELIYIAISQSKLLNLLTFI